MFWLFLITISSILRTLTAIRYVTPLREGGSLPAIVEANDNQLYVLKFRGAGQGRKALIAELIAGEIARALNLNVPEIVLMHLDSTFGNEEPDPEIQDLLRASTGMNLALAYLPGALMFDPLADATLDSALASAIVWFDAYATNVDRTAKNPNLLWCNEKLWLIDHGASLYFHHTWKDYRERARQPFMQIHEHVLLRYANALPAADARLSARLTEERLRAIVDAIPDEWLAGEASFPDTGQVRDAYFTFLWERLRAPRAFALEAQVAHATRV